MIFSLISDQSFHHEEDKYHKEQLYDCFLHIIHNDTDDRKQRLSYSYTRMDFLHLLWDVRLHETLRRVSSSSYSYILMMLHIPY